MRGEIFDILKSLTGQQNILTIPSVFVNFTGSLEAALFLSQLLYWTDRTTDGWVAKTYAGWKAELGLSEFEVRKVVKVLKGMGILHTQVKKFAGNPTVHYRLDENALVDGLVSFLKKFKDRSFENSRNDPLEIKGTILQKSKEPTLLHRSHIETTIYRSHTYTGGSENNQPDHSAEDQDLQSGVDLVIKELNTLAGRSFRPWGKQAGFIRARLKEGFTVEDCLQVVRHQVREWKNDARMRKYLRPETLFNSLKFESYLNDARSQQADKPVLPPGVPRDWYDFRKYSPQQVQEWNKLVTTPGLPKGGDNGNRDSS